MQPYKLIREGRFGAPKSNKTGAIVGTYPRPMLIIEGDKGGLSVIPHSPPLPSCVFKSDVTYGDIKFFDSVSEFEHYASMPTADLPPICCASFAEDLQPFLSDIYAVTPNGDAYPMFNRIGNTLLSGKCPWKTVLVDPVTRLTEAVLGHMAAVNPKRMDDARNWASNAGLKVLQTVSGLTNLPCHVVFTFHEETDKNDLTGTITTAPLVYSKARQMISGLFAQFLYADIQGGKPVVFTQPTGFVKGIGCRWPVNLAPVCGAHFWDIYGKSVESGEIEDPRTTVLVAK